MALEEIDKRYPTAPWTHIYTDGSDENATGNGGCHAYHYVSRQTSSLCVSTWWDTVLKQQSQSPTTAKCHKNPIKLWEKKPKKAVFFTDSQSALQTLTSGEPDTTLTKLIANSNTLTQSSCIVFRGYQCTPALWKMKQQTSWQMYVLQRSQSSS